MTSVYKHDYGNGVVVYADYFVKTGKWVFDCNNSRLISRKPLLPPLPELEGIGKLNINAMYYLEKTEREQAKAAIKAITGITGWYEKLIYRFSRLDEYSELNSHIFDLLARHNDQVWVLNVWQRVGSQGQSSFEINAEPYDPDTYVDYAKALESAAQSCPVPQ